MLPTSLPRELGRYRLLELIGKGGMGSVYRAQQLGPLDFQPIVAVKLVEPRLARANPDLVLSLADEARLLSHVRHPNIVGVTTFEQIEDPELGTVHALVLEYVAGCALEELLRPGGGPARALPLEAIRCVLEDSLSALDHAHEATDSSGRPLGLVHRDLKPQNIMVDERGSLRLLDFGIAWAVDKLVQTGMNMTKGTPPYMSPEQLYGQPLDGRSDLFVLGTIAFEMLTGACYVRRPTTQGDLVRVVQELAAARYEPSTVEAELAGRADGLAPWLGRLLASAPADRFPTAAQALAALRGLSLPVEAPGRRWLAAGACEAGLSEPPLDLTGRRWTAEQPDTPEPTKPFPHAAEPGPTRPFPPTAEPAPPRPSHLATEPRPPRPSPPRLEPGPTRPFPPQVELPPTQPLPRTSAPSPRRPAPQGAGSSLTAPMPSSARPAPAPSGGATARASAPPPLESDAVAVFDRASIGALLDSERSRRTERTPPPDDLGGLETWKMDVVVPEGDEEPG